MFDPPSSTGGTATPSLLDRLIRSTSPGELSDQSFISSVERDILWLFNTTPRLIESGSEISRRYPQVASSVLNFGLRHIFDQTVQDLGRIEHIIAEAIRCFEPRMILEHTKIEITRAGQLVEIHLEGRLRVDGGRKDLWIRTSLETLESTLDRKSDG